MRTILSILCIALALAGTVAADELTDGKRADIKRLMKLSGTDSIGNRVGQAVAQQIRSAIEQQVPVQKQRVMDVADDVLEQWTRQFASDEELLRELVGIYARSFTHEEIEQLIDFYETDLGQKVITEMPRIAAESMRVGQRVAQRLVPELEAKMQKRFDEEGITDVLKDQGQ